MSELSDDVRAFLRNACQTVADQAAVVDAILSACERAERCLRADDAEGALSILAGLREAAVPYRVHTAVKAAGGAA